MYLTLQGSALSVLSGLFLTVISVAYFMFMFIQQSLESVLVAFKKCSQLRLAINGKLQKLSLVTKDFKLQITIVFIEHDNLKKMLDASQELSELVDVHEDSFGYIILIEALVCSIGTALGLYFSSVLTLAVRNGVLNIIAISMGLTFLFNGISYSIRLRLLFKRYHLLLCIVKTTASR